MSKVKKCLGLLDRKLKNKKFRKQFNAGHKLFKIECAVLNCLEESEVDEAVVMKIAKVFEMKSL